MLLCALSIVFDFNKALLDRRVLDNLAARNYRSVSVWRLWFRNDLGESADKLNALLTA